jgi:predicted RNA-binding protein YlxR (DUF448 family)/ribosomal protein L30E
MKHQPERTCVACRVVFKKDEVVRIVAEPAPTVSGSAGIVIDYREKLPGRAAYVCPKGPCIKTAIEKGHFSRALRLKVKNPSLGNFIERLTAAMEGKIKSLIAMSAKAGKLAAGYSAVQDALEKGRVALLLYAGDISEGTKEKVTTSSDTSIPSVTLFSRDELGKLLNRELVGVIGIEDKGFADAIRKEGRRLKVLINAGE